MTPVVPRPQGRPDPRPSIGPIVGDPSPIDRIGSPMEKGGLIGGILVDRGRVRRIDLGSPDGNSAVQRRPCWRKTNEPRTRTRPSRRFLPRLGLDGNIRVAGRTGRSTKAGYATYARKPCGRNRPDGSRPWTVHAWTFRSGSGAWSGPSGSRREATSRPWCRVRAERSVSERSFQSLGTVCRLVTRIRRVVAPVDDPGTDAVILEFWTRPSRRCPPLLRFCVRVGDGNRADFPLRSRIRHRWFPVPWTHDRCSIPFVLFRGGRKRGAPAYGW